MSADKALRAHLDGVRGFLTHYVAFPSEHEAIAVALWVAHAQHVEAFDTSPIMAVTSAEKRSGKTRLLDCLELLVPHPFRCVIPSEAVTYTVLSQRPRPTLLLDEADAIFGPRTADKYEGLRAILNSGNRRGTPVLRVKLEGKRREVEAFDVFGAKAVAGIGKLPDTVADRAIPIRLKRRAPNEPVAKFRQRIAAAEVSSLPAGIDLGGADVTLVTVPEELNDRAADSWESLLAIADLAGEEWPGRARTAAIVLSGEGEADLSTGMRLLADIHDVFQERGTDHLPTSGLLHDLHDHEDSPWAEWYGQPLSARGLARLLEPYRVRPLLRRVKGTPQRGYFAPEFRDAWARYLPAPASVTSETSVTPSTNGIGPVTLETHVTVPRTQAAEGEADLLEQLRVLDG